MIAQPDIFSLAGQKQFDKIALKVFRYQHEHNVVYREFCDHLQVDQASVKSLRQIPFLPIQFFKTHKVITRQAAAQQTFTSSGTTSSHTSRHFVTDVSWYEHSFRNGFSQFYGDIQNYVVLALLPSYLEREGSSLIYMVDNLIKASNRPESGFYLNDYEALAEQLVSLDELGQNVLLIGVTFALLDLLERRSFDLKNTIIMETGGMKGRRKEMIREELHAILEEGFGVPVIHSEYGMTELLSQAYSLGNGIFECPNWMQILIRDPEDALSYLETGKTGGINVVDLANIHSCAFIATQDLGRKNSNNSFEVLGRFDHSDIRGCNLMVL